MIGSTSTGTIVTALKFVYGTVWQGTIGGWLILSDLQGKEPSRISLLPPGTVSPVISIELTGDTVWIGYSNGLVFAVSAATRDILFRDSCPDGLSSLNAFETQVWAGTATGYIVAWDATTFAKKFAVQAAPGVPIGAVCFVNDLLFVVIETQIGPYDGKTMNALAQWPPLPSRLSKIKAYADAASVTLVTTCVNGKVAIWGPFDPASIVAQAPQPVYVGEQSPSDVATFADVIGKDVWVVSGNKLSVYRDGALVTEQPLASACTAMTSVPDCGALIALGDNSLHMLSL